MSRDAIYFCKRCGKKHLLPDSPRSEIYTKNCECCDSEERATLLIKEKSGEQYREQISPNQELAINENGVFIQRMPDDDNDSGFRYDVIKGRFKPIRKLMLDGEPVFEVEMSKKFRGNAEEVYRMAKQEGKVVDRRKASDCINRLLQGMDMPTIQSHATYGIYRNDNGQLELYLEPHPRTEIQQQLEREIQRAGSLNTELSKEALAPWYEIPNFWHPYEVLPQMGLAVMAPFALPLREKNIIVPHIYSYSPESGIGKTETARLFTEFLYGKRKLSSDSINSSYRLADGMDAFGGPICIDEAEKFNWRKFLPHIKMATESPIQDSRGTPNLGSRQYWSRATFFFTGNKFPITSKSGLIRMLKIEFDMGAKRQRQDKQQRIALKNCRKQLKPVGWRLAEMELEAIDGSLSTLEALIDRHADRIEEAVGVFADPRRATEWGVVYEGLKVWELAAQRYGLKCRAPSYTDFARNVVGPIEMTTFESLELPAEDFINWWQSWKVNHTVKKIEEPTGIVDYETKGKGEIWAEKTIDYDGETISGDIVTNPILKEYRDRAVKEIPISSMPELAKGISALTGIPHKELYGTWYMGIENRQKGVFIPNNIHRGGENSGYTVTSAKNGDLTEGKNVTGESGKKHSGGYGDLTEVNDGQKTQRNHVTGEMPTPTQKNKTKGGKGDGS